jgi:hypothetical protein
MAEQSGTLSGAPLKPGFALSGRFPIKHRDIPCSSDFKASASVSCCGSLSRR